MIAVDTQVLVYAHRRDSPWYEPAKECVRKLAEGIEPWAIPWSCIHEFYAIVTHPKIYTPPSTREQASDQLDAWLASPSLVLLGEAVTHWDTLRELLKVGKVTGPVVHDARIAAVCVEHRVSELWTADRDFSRFKDLATKNPLV